MTEKTYRSAERKIIKEACLSYEPFLEMPNKWQDRMVISIESGILDATLDKAKELNILNMWNIPQFVEIYSSIGYYVVSSLDIHSSVNKNKTEEVRCYLIDSVIEYMRTSGKLGVNPRSLGKMNPLELNPHINKDIIAQLKLRGEQSIKLKYSTMYKCEKCGAKKAKEREIQTRSLDEGKTLFIECIQCGHTWRKYG